MMPSLPDCVQNPGQRSRTVSVGLCCLVLAMGCGSEVYQDRLDTTAKYFSSIELQNAHLHGPWTDAPTTISLRLPLQFAELPPPADNAVADGAGGEASGGLGSEPAATEMEEEETDEADEGDETPASGGAPGSGGSPRRTLEEDLPPDPRQPQFLTAPLPGLRGAFKATLSVVGANGRSAPGSGYVYVLSNHHLAGSQELSSRFHTDVIATLTSALGVTTKPEDSRELTVPSRPDAFLKPTTYTELEIEPAEQGDEMAREFGVATRFSLYLHTNGDVQVAILFVLPRDLDSAERFPSRRTLCLETLRIENPQLTKPGGTPSVSSPTGSSF